MTTHETLRGCYVTLFSEALTASGDETPVKKAAALDALAVLIASLWIDHRGLPMTDANGIGLYVEIKKTLSAWERENVARN